METMHCDNGTFPYMDVSMSLVGSFLVKCMHKQQRHCIYDKALSKMHEHSEFSPRQLHMDKENDSCVQERR